MIDIIIEKIEMLNFGPYYRNHEILFKNEGEGIHLIRGGNGQGKTSIQRAILWALYGSVKDRRGDEIRLTSLLNHTARGKDLYQFTVQIHFNHEGQNWKIARSSKAKTHQDKQYKKGMFLEVYKDGNIVPNPENEIQRILPSNVSRFYFFDGEMLRDYEELLEGDNAAITLLKKSIEQVLGVPYLKTAQVDLKAVNKKYEGERKRIMRELGETDFEDWAELQQTLEDDLEKIEYTISKTEGDKEKLETKNSENKRNLADMKDVQELGNSRIQLEGNIEKEEAKKENKVLERSVLVEKLYKNVLSPTAKNLIQQLTIKSKQELNKYNKKQQAMQKAENLKKGIAGSKCSYCGTVLDQKKLADFNRQLDETNMLIEELTQIPEPNLSFEQGKTVLEKMMQSVISPEDLKEMDKQTIKIEYKIERLQAELERVKSKLEGVDDKEPKNLELEIRRTEQEVGRLSGIIETKQDEKLKLLKDKSEVDRMIDSIPQDQLQKLKEMISFVKRICGVFETAVSEFREEQKDKVESTATEIFRQIRSKEEFDRLEINDQYGLSIITTHNTTLNRSEWRSSGEEQIVALSLIGALNKCAQVEAPIFMDTPFGRLDVSHGERVLKFLPKMSQQLVLLVTDREFREGDEVHLGGHIKTDLTLKYKGEKEGSIILPTTEGVIES